MNLIIYLALSGLLGACTDTPEPTPIDSGTMAANDASTMVSQDAQPADASMMSYADAQIVMDGFTPDVPAVMDAGELMDAAFVMDAESHPDATASVDAMVIMDAVVNVDAMVLMDAASSPDAGSTCGTVGNTCASSSACAGFMCKLPQGICVPNTVDTCGGFAGAQCPSSRPNCMYFVQADYGPCYTDVEKDCICRSAARSVYLTGSLGCP